MAKPATPPDSVTLSKFSGLRNNVTPERLAQGELTRAVNVDIDDSGQLRRRRGFTRVLSGDLHSLFTADDGTLYAVLSGNLGVINADYSFTSFHKEIHGDPDAQQLSYVDVAGTVYFSNAMSSGKVVNGSVLPWGPAQNFFLSPVVNPTANLPAIRNRLMGAPPLATGLAYYNGRIYLASGRVVWATELYLYDLVDKTKNFMQFEGDITMIGSVTDGLYVGTTEGLYFLSGTLGEMKRVSVMNSAVIPGSLVSFPGELGNPPQIPPYQDTPVKVSLLFMTTEGYCAGQDGGQVFNFTESKYIFPDATRAVAMYRWQDGISQYVVALNSGGTPSSTARFGDYVDAELVRFSA